MPICAICKESLPTRKPCISCSICEAQVHPGCITTTADLVLLLSAVRGLSWRCDSCLGDCITVGGSEIKNFLDKKVEKALTVLESRLAAIQSEVCRSIKADAVPPATIATYSSILKNKSSPAVIIQPKDETQTPSQTRSDISRNIGLDEDSIHLRRLKNLKNGGVLIECKSGEQNERLKKAVEDKLSDSYVVRELRGICPRVKIVGMSEDYSADSFIRLLKKCNPELFSVNTECKVVKMFPTKKNENIFQCILELDRVTYDRVIKSGNVFIGFDSCGVYDAIDIYRCFNCNDFNHSSKSCKKSLCCPLCGLAHDVKSCKSKSRRCSNCSVLNTKHSLSVPVDHAVWEKDKCSAYKRAVGRLRDGILQ